jgi:hypothetical protein
VLAILIVIAVGAVVGGIAVLLLGHQRRFDEVDRFHRASRMTTEWSRSGVTKPLIAEQETRRSDRDRADATRD